MVKKISKKIFFVLAIMLLGGLGGIIADRYFFPYLSSTKIFSRYDFIKKGSESITVINKTEQITVKEETSINKITNQVSSSIVNIISYPEKGMPAKKEAVAKNGTGLIVTGDGMIMTYASAISPNASYKVMTYDGNVYDGALLGIDSYSNLAFLKINASNLSVASFGDSDSIKPGEKVIAIANSFGSYANKYASGLISDFNPSFNLAGLGLSSSEKLEGVYKTDFNDQRYFVGGPVVDYNGQIEGITGVIEKDNLSNYFLIPSNKVKAVIERAIKKDLEKNVVLGAYYVPINKTYAIENNLALESGAMIYSASGQQGLATIANSPAQKAGLQIGDIIVAVGSEKISSTHSLSGLLYKYFKGDKIELVVMRNGEEMKIPVQL